MYWLHFFSRKNWEISSKVTQVHLGNQVGIFHTSYISFAHTRYRIFVVQLKMLSWFKWSGLDMLLELKLAIAKAIFINSVKENLKKLDLNKSDRENGVLFWIGIIGEVLLKLVSMPWMKIWFNCLSYKGSFAKEQMELIYCEHWIWIKSDRDLVKNRIHEHYEVTWLSQCLISNDFGQLMPLMICVLKLVEQ